MFSFDYSPHLYPYPIQSFDEMKFDRSIDFCMTSVGRAVLLRTSSGVIVCNLGLCFEGLV